ncbi:MAG: hypothetical protein OEX12_01020 [Gammaproteobacteria bacterium]|nr:hypothetical protein [Gammaproteobacteria bacterium]
MAMTNAQRQRALRQEALREQLKAGQLLTQYINTINKMIELDPSDENFPNELSKLKVVNENRRVLINKCLPDEKTLDVQGDVGLSGGLTITWEK